MHALLRVHDQHAHIGALDRPRGAQRRVELDVVVHLAALAQPSRVDEHQRAALVTQRRIDRVARGTGLVRHHQPLAVQQPIHQARLAHVGAPHHGHGDLTPVNAGLAPGNPGLRPGNPGLAPGNLGLAPGNPGLTPGARRRTHVQGPEDLHHAI